MVHDYHQISEFNKNVPGHNLQNEKKNNSRYYDIILQQRQNSKIYGTAYSMEPLRSQDAT